MNNYFVNITKTLAISKWPEKTLNIPNENIVTKAISKYKNHPSIKMIKNKIGNIQNKFELQHILPEVVHKQVKLLDASKSASGNIPTKIIKNSINIYVNQLTDCLNTSICEGTFPSTMKCGDVTPAFKKDENFFKENYRPICTLSPLSKVFERILCEQINTFIGDKLSDKLCGFRKGYNTQHALHKMLENWRLHLDNKEKVGVILCDLSKAFDTLPHDLIIAKLEAYGFGDGALKLIYDYLNDRKQRCKVGSSYSTWLDVLTGVPQGSVLGPLLFNVFVNDFFYFINESEVCNFADDNSIYASGKTLDEVCCKLEKDMKNAMKWFKINSLEANPKKFQLMFLGTKAITKKCLNINGKYCFSKTSVLLLGIIIDWKLNFNEHIKHLCSMAENRVRALYRLRSTLDSKQKLMLFNSFLLSIFNYCPIVWMFYGKSSADMINNIQKRALRALYNDFSSNYVVLLNRGNHITIHEENKRRLLLEVFKCIKGENPPLLNGLFLHKGTQNNLRINNRLILPKTTTKTYGLHSFVYRGSRAWNTLADDLKTLHSSKNFKASIKNIKDLECSCKLCIKE